MENIFITSEQWAGLAALALLAIALWMAIKARKRDAPSARAERQGEKPPVEQEQEPTEEQPGEAPPADGLQNPEPLQTEEIQQTPLPEKPTEEVVQPITVLERIRQGLGKTRNNLTTGLSTLLRGGKTIDEDLLEEIEAQLIMADVGINATQEIIASLTTRMQRQELADSERLYEALKQELATILQECSLPLKIKKQSTPFVILMVGVNGAGKTTTIGKLAKYLQKQDLNVMLAAGDTFRAAAVEQLSEWGHRNNIPVIAQQTGADSASVIYDALAAATARGTDVLIADTAGRLQNNDSLMAELAKIKRVMGKIDPATPHEVMLVLDAGTGQNAISQAKLFNETVGVTGITLTKLDGTAKGGVIFAIAQQLKLPIRFIGVGEHIDDLREFDADQFVTALFD